MSGHHAKILKRIREVFDPRTLEAICAMREDEFSAYGKRYALPTDDSRFFFYQDNKSPILAVAHLDSVQKDQSCSVVELKTGAKIVFSPVLDDRLGVWVIVDLLPKLGLRTDILLTTGEEKGRSTAELYEPKHREYNWMFQFDRKESDVVMYHYDNAERRAMLKGVGADPGWGSFSDICELGHLKVAGFNWGVGYQDYHSSRAYAWLDDTFNQVARFVRFYQLYKRQKMVHEGRKRTHYVSVYDWDDSDAYSYKKDSSPIINSQYRTVNHHHPKDNRGSEDGSTEAIGKRIEAELNRGNPIQPTGFVKGGLAWTEEICICSPINPQQEPHRRYSHLRGAPYGSRYGGSCNWHKCSCKGFQLDFSETISASEARLKKVEERKTKAVYEANLEALKVKEEALERILEGEQKVFPLLSEGQYLLTDGKLTQLTKEAN